MPQIAVLEARATAPPLSSAGSGGGAASASAAVPPPLDAQQLAKLSSKGALTEALHVRVPPTCWAGMA